MCVRKEIPANNNKETTGVSECAKKTFFDSTEKKAQARKVQPDKRNHKGLKEETLILYQSSISDGEGQGEQEKKNLRDTGIALCGMSCSLLGSGEDELKLLRVVNGIKDGQDGSSWVSKDMLHVVAQHHLVEDLASRHTHKRVVMCWLCCRWSLLLAFQRVKLWCC
jgi:hypothetical protein